MPFLIFLFLLPVYFSLSQGPADLNYVFTAGESGYTCFRIPAMLVTQSGDLLAFAEGRKNGCSDTGDIDLVMKRSGDGGKSWGPLAVIWNDGDNTCGNPAPILEAESGKLILLSTWNLGEDREREIIDQTSKDTRRIFVLSSDDEGRSWSDPREITRAVKAPTWTWYATGPGSGIQLLHGNYRGRLMVACDHIEAGSKKYYSHVIYSDDQGKTWQLGGTTPLDQVNECEVVERTDGNLLLTMRNYDRSRRMRQRALSFDGGSTWKYQGFDSTLIEPICQASIHRLSFPIQGRSKIAFSNPASKEKRENMTVRISFDEGESWPLAQVLHEGPSAYSDLVALSPTRLGCLFEGGRESPYEGIAYITWELGE